MLTDEEWKNFNRPSAGIEACVKVACSMDFELAGQSVGWSISQKFIYDLFIYLGR